jgi:hypothetical protein
MTQLIVLVDGKEYRTKEDDSAEAAEVAEQFYQIADAIDRLKLPLDDGGFLVLPKETVRRATFIVRPTPTVTGAP